MYAGVMCAGVMCAGVIYAGVWELCGGGEIFSLWAFCTNRYNMLIGYDLPLHGLERSLFVMYLIIWSLELCVWWVELIGCYSVMNLFNTSTLLRFDFGTFSLFSSLSPLLSISLCLSVRLSHTPISSVSASSTKGSLPLEVDGVHLSHEDARKARVLYDFDAERDDQMSVTSDQVQFCGREG